MEISVLSQSNPFSSCKRFSLRYKPSCLLLERSFKTVQCVAHSYHKQLRQHGVIVGPHFEPGHPAVQRLTANNISWTCSFSSTSREGRKFSCIGPFHMCKALGEDQNRQDGPDGNEPDSSEDQSISKSGEVVGSTSTDWRTFRARLISMEQLTTSDIETPGSSQERREKKIFDSWAHPILTPEPGCVLIATEKLDGLSIFERTVILLLSDGLNGSSDGPFGLILNRPLPHTVKDMRPNDVALIEAFGNSQVHFGGPLISDLILLHCGGNHAKGSQEVIPGVCFSSAESLESAAELVREKKSRPEDTRFFFGYAGWAINQLKDETENGYWYVAACSTNLFMLPSPVNLWEDILCMMGGQYADLSKKPKRRLQ